jgi:hypothetical protein
MVVASIDWLDVYVWTVRCHRGSRASTFPNASAAIAAFRVPT